MKIRWNWKAVGRRNQNEVTDIKEIIEKAEYIGLYPSGWGRYLYRINTYTGCFYIRLSEKDVWPDNLTCWEHEVGEPFTPIWSFLPVETFKRLCFLPEFQIAIHSMNNSKQLKKPVELRGIKRAFKHVSHYGHGRHRMQSTTQFFISGDDVWMREPCARCGHFMKNEKMCYYQWAAWFHLKNAVPVMQSKDYFAARTLWHRALAPIHEDGNYVMDTFWDDIFATLHKSLQIPPAVELPTGKIKSPKKGDKVA